MDSTRFFIILFKMFDLEILYLKKKNCFMFCHIVVKVQYFLVFVCDLGQRKSALYRLWTMSSGVHRNWDGLILGNVNNFHVNLFFLLRVYFFLICNSLTISHELSANKHLNLVLISGKVQISLKEKVNLN